MKRHITSVLAIALVLAVAGCEKRASVDAHRHRSTIYHLSDGRYAYHGDDGLWYYLIMTNPGATYQPGVSPWQAGAAPSSEALQSATAQPVVMNETAAGAPESIAATTETTVGGDAVGTSSAESVVDTSSSFSDGGGASSGGDSGGGSSE